MEGKSRSRQRKGGGTPGIPGVVETTALHRAKGLEQNHALKAITIIPTSH